MDNTHTTQKTSRVLFWSLVGGIIIVLNLFFNYSATLVFHEPVFEGYCPIDITNKAYSNKEQCLSVGGSWTENSYPYTPEKSQVETRPTQLSVSESVTGWCNATYTCQKGYDGAHKVYNRNIFIALVALGVLAIVLGFVFASVSAVSLGFSLGGVLSLIIGSIRYWSDMNDIVRVLILAAALAVLVWLGVKKMKE